MSVVIGIDFDNTLVSYDALFHRIAVEREHVPADTAVNKRAVRDHYRSTGREEEWTLLQGEVYGARIREADPFPGALEWVRAATDAGFELRVVSHKTERPFAGPPHDLRGAARGWLEYHGFLDAGLAGVLFESTVEEKVSRIAAIGAECFIDDLPELLSREDWPREVRRVLFDPARTDDGRNDWVALHDWRDLSAQALMESAT